MKVLIFRCGNIKEPEWISWIIIRRTPLESGIKKMTVIPGIIRFIFGRHINITLDIQGDEVGKNAEIYLYVIADGKKYVSGLVELDGWQDWKKVTIDNIKCTKGDVKIGVYVDHAADGWGMIDDFYFGQE